MKQKDLEACRECFSKWADHSSHRSILLLSPDPAQTDLFKELLPNAQLTEWQIQHYDIDSGPPPGRFDVAFAANVFMCSRDPAKWIKNVLSSCDELWLQDLVRAWRDGHRETSPETGDYVRYSFPSRGEFTRVEGFDIESCDECQVDAAFFYDDDGASAPDGFKDCRKFVARLKRPEWEYRFPEKIVLDEESAKELAEKIANPPDPSDALIESFKKHRNKKDA